MLNFFAQQALVATGKPLHCAFLYFMSILKYLKSKDGLPDPKGPHSMEIAGSAITSANREVQKKLRRAARKHLGDHTTGS